MYTARSLFWLLCCLHIVDLFYIEIDTEGERQSRWATAGEWTEMGVRCGLNYMLVHFKIAKTHLSEFHCYFNLICAALECGQDWQRQCSISRDLCTWATCWEYTNFLRTSDSPCHFLIMVWFLESFSVFFFTCIIKGKQVKSAITHAITNLRGKITLIEGPGDCESLTELHLDGRRRQHVVPFVPRK